MQDSIKKIAAIYEQAGAKDKFTGRFDDGPHRFTRAMQDVTFSSFAQHVA